MNTWEKPEGEGRTYQKPGALFQLQKLVQDNLRSPAPKSSASETAGAKSMRDPFLHPDDPQVIRARNAIASRVPRDLTAVWVRENPLRAVEEIARLRVFEGAVRDCEEACAGRSYQSASARAVVGMAALERYLGAFK